MLKVYQKKTVIMKMWMRKSVIYSGQEMKHFDQCKPMVKFYVVEKLLTVGQYLDST